MSDQQLQQEQELHDMMEFINQCPFGIIKADETGKINLQNASASQILLPFCLEQGWADFNIFEIIEKLEPEWLERIKGYKESFGGIVNNERTMLTYANRNVEQYLAFSIIKINETSYQYAFNDVTASVKAEKQLNELIETKAVEDGKLQMATGILHDIGNAITSFGTEIAKIKNKATGKEYEELGKLENLFKSEKDKIDTSLGSGKANALVKFLEVVRNSLKKRSEDTTQVVNRLYQTTSHIQDILNIQRSYVKGKTSGERAPFKLDTVISDALAIQEHGLVKRSVKIYKDIPLNTPSISGDKTKLIQVMINCLKNSAESYDELKDSRSRELYIKLNTDQDRKVVTLSILDNANGFPPEIAEDLMIKGNTFKKSGSGFGLYNCKQIVESHKGTIQLTSDGPGKGANLRIELPYTEERTR